MNVRLKLTFGTAAVCIVGCGATVSVGPTTAGGLSESLAFSGTLTGHVSTASPSSVCGKGLVFPYQAEFVINVGDGPREVAIDVGPYRGPGTYAVSNADSAGGPSPTAVTTVEIFHAGGGQNTTGSAGGLPISVSADAPEYAAISGQVTVQSDEHSGKVTATLTPSNGGVYGDPASTKTVTVSGSWRCG